MRYASKQEFLCVMNDEHETFLRLVRSVPARRYKEPGVWGSGWSIHDLLAHLTAWEQMFFRWYNDGLQGKRPVIPAPGYKYHQIPLLNRDIQKRNRHRSTRSVWEDFDTSYSSIRTLAEQLTEPQLLRPGSFAWTGKYPLTTYLGPNTCSHYRFAIKVLKRWLRRQGLPIRLAEEKLKLTKTT